MANHVTRRLSRLLLNYTKQKHMTYAVQKFNFSTVQNSQDKRVVDYESYLKISKAGPSSSKDTIVQVLHISKNALDDSFKQYPKLKQISPKDILWNYQLLINSGVLKPIIRENVYLLAHSDNELERKIRIIKNYGLDINDSIIFAELSINMLQIFMSYCIRENISPADKINTFCELFKENIKTICLYFKRNKHLRTQPLGELKKKIQLLLENGFTTHGILTDGTVLGYTLSKIKNNLKLMSELNIEDKKSWMIRSTKQELEKHVEYYNSMNKINGEPMGITEYIVHRMKCKEDVAEYLVLRNPYIARISISKAKKMFDVLQEFDLKPEQIINTSQIFMRNPTTIRNRLVIVKEKLGYIPRKIHFLYMTNKKFEEYVEESSNLSNYQMEEDVSS